MKTLVVAPNEAARVIMGSATEMCVGWKYGEFVLWWGSCKNEASLSRLLDELREKHGDIEVERLA